MPLVCGSDSALSHTQGVNSLCRSQQHAMTGRSATYCVNVCVVARAPQLLEVCICLLRTLVVRAVCECPSKARLYLRQRRRPAIGKGMAVPAHNARGDRLRTAPEAGMARASRRSARRARNKRLRFGSPVRGGRRSRRAPNQPSPESSDAMSGDVVARRSWRGSRVHGPWRAVAGARD